VIAYKLQTYLIELERWKGIRYHCIEFEETFYQHTQARLHLSVNYNNLGLRFTYTKTHRQLFIITSSCPKAILRFSVEFSQAWKSLTKLYMYSVWVKSNQPTSSSITKLMSLPHCSSSQDWPISHYHQCLCGAKQIRDPDLQCRRWPVSWHPVAERGGTSEYRSRSCWDHLKRKTASSAWCSGERRDCNHIHRPYKRLYYWSLFLYLKMEAHWRFGHDNSVG